MFPSSLYPTTKNVSNTEKEAQFIKNENLLPCSWKLWKKSIHLHIYQTPRLSLKAANKLQFIIHFRSNMNFRSCRKIVHWLYIQYKKKIERVSCLLQLIPSCSQHLSCLLLKDDEILLFDIIFKEIFLDDVMSLTDRRIQRVPSILHQSNLREWVIGLLRYVLVGSQWFMMIHTKQEKWRCRMGQKSSLL